jgi:hypothetical protein
MATTLKIGTNRLNIVHLLPTPQSYGLKSGIFKPRRGVSISAECPLQQVQHRWGDEPAFMMLEFQDLVTMPAIKPFGS